MARNTDVWKFLMLCMMAPVTQVALAQAQAQQAPQVAPPQAQQAKQAPSPAPPQKLERIEEVGEIPTTIPEASIRQPEITQRRAVGGQVTEVQVKSGVSTYTMQANTPGLIQEPDDRANGNLQPPMWKIFEFDLFNKNKREAQEAAAATTPPPPPPPSTK